MHEELLVVDGVAEGAERACALAAADVGTAGAGERYVGALGEV